MIEKRAIIEQGWTPPEHGGAAPNTATSTVRVEKQATATELEEHVSKRAADAAARRLRRPR